MKTRDISLPGVRLLSRVKSGSKESRMFFDRSLVRSTFHRRVVMTEKEFLTIRLSRSLSLFKERGVKKTFACTLCVCVRISLFLPGISHEKFNLRMTAEDESHSFFLNNLLLGRLTERGNKSVSWACDKKEWIPLETYFSMWTTSYVIWCCAFAKFLWSEWLSAALIHAVTSMHFSSSCLRRKNLSEKHRERKELEAVWVPWNSGQHMGRESRKQGS